MATDTLNSPLPAAESNRLSPEWQRQLNGIEGAVDYIERIDVSASHDGAAENKADVTALREHMAALIEHVYSHLFTDHDPAEVSFDMMRESICTTVLDVVTDAKSQGLPLEQCATMLQPLLAVYASMPDESKRAIARVLVAQGLAPELIQATIDTRNIVYAEPQNPSQWHVTETPLSEVATSSAMLLAAAVDDVPKFIKTTIIEDGVEYLERLGLESLKALYEATQRSGDADKSRQIITQALANIVSSIHRNKYASNNTSETLASIFKYAVESGLTTELEEATELMRVTSLNGGASQKELVITLLNAGKEDIAKMLLTPGKKLERYAGTSEPHIVDALTRLENQKEQELFDILCAKDMPKDGDYFKKILQATDPQSAMYIPDDFTWKDDHGNPSDEFIQLTVDKPDLTVSLGLRALQVMHTRVFGAEFIKFAEAHAMSLQEQSKYFTEFFDLVNKVSDANQEIIRALLSRDDPNGTLRLVDKLGIKELATEDVEFFCRCSGRDQSVIEAINRISERIGATAPLEVIKKMLDFPPDFITTHLTAILGACDMFHITEQDASAVLNLSARMGYNPECLNSLRQIKESSNLTNIQLVEVMSYLSFDDNYISPVLLNEIILIQKMLAENGIALEDILNLSFLDVLDCMEEPNRYKLLHLFAAQQIADAYVKKATPLIGKKPGDPGVAADKTIDLEKQELPIKLLEKLGLPVDKVHMLLQSWLSFRPLAKMLYAKKDKDVTIDMIYTASRTMQEHIYKEMNALKDVIDYLGLEDCLDVISTFGITRFSSYTMVELGAQLDRWRAGTIATTHIVIRAYADWNNAFSQYPKETLDAIKKSGASIDGVVFFEARSVGQMGRAAAKVGARERKNGRIPKVDSVIVGAHGSPTGIILGPNNEESSVQGMNDAITTINSNYDEPKSIMKALRLIDYTEHLGPHYRIILNACSTAADVENGSNYSQALSEFLGVRVDGATKLTYGSAVINPDGSVTFNDGTLEAKTYKAGIEL